MRDVYATILEVLIMNQLMDYEGDAIIFSQKYGGTYFAYEGQACSFGDLSTKHLALVPYNKEFFALVKRFKALSTEKGIIYAFVKGADRFKNIYEKKHPISRGNITVATMLPDEYRNLMPAWTFLEDTSEIKALRDQFKLEYFKLDVQRLLIKYRLLNLK